MYLLSPSEAGIADPTSRCGKRGSGKLSDLPGVTERVSGHHQDLSPESDSEAGARNRLAPASGKLESSSLGAGQSGPSHAARFLPRCARRAEGPAPVLLPGAVPKDASTPWTSDSRLAPLHARPLPRPRALTIAAAAASPLRLLCPSGRSARDLGGSGGRGGACLAGAGGEPSGSGDRNLVKSVKSEAAGDGSRGPGSAPLPGPPAPGSG